MSGCAIGPPNTSVESLGIWGCNRLSTVAVVFCAGGRLEVVLLEVKMKVLASMQWKFKGISDGKDSS